MRRISIESLFLEHVLIRTNELCRDHNWLSISDEFECRRAAKSIFGDNIIFFGGSSLELPKGCTTLTYLTQGDYVPPTIVYNMREFGLVPPTCCSPICWTGRKSKYFLMSL